MLTEDYNNFLLGIFHEKREAEELKYLQLCSKFSLMNKYKTACFPIIYYFGMSNTFQINLLYLLGVFIHTCNPSIQKAGAGGSRV